MGLVELSFVAFIASYLAYVYRYRPELVNPEASVTDTPQSNLNNAYDVIIVGGGTAGCVLAGRLTENPKLSVLVIEAGGDEGPINTNLLLFRAVRNTDLDWNFTAVPRKDFCLDDRNGVCPLPRGHVLGGTSSIDDVTYTRGSIKDYDNWAALGNPEWNWKNVSYYFRKLEDYRIPELGKSPIHGYNGPMPVSYPTYRSNLRPEYVKAGVEFGIPQRDYNGPHLFAVDFTQLHSDGYTSISTAQAYLVPAAKRRNLTVIKRSLVSKILIDNKNCAQGVEYIRNGRKHTVNANREVIIAAGPVNSPKLLMLSGIGPRKELSRIGVKTIVDSPVGQNLKDHPAVEISFLVNQPLTMTTNKWRTNRTIEEFAIKKRGLLTSTGEAASAFLNVDNFGEEPNVELRIFTFTPLEYLNMTQNVPLVVIRPVLCVPKSSGTLTLRSKDVYDPPVIDPNYLAEIDDYRTLRKGLQKAIEFMNTPTMRKYSPKIYTGYIPACRKTKGDELLDCLMRQESFGMAHLVSGARMGGPRDRNAVVNSSDLRVRGVDKLRVVGNSVHPEIISGHPLIATIMVAEKASDIMKNDLSPSGMGSSNNQGYNKPSYN